MLPNYFVGQAEEFGVNFIQTPILGDYIRIRVERAYLDESENLIVKLRLMALLNKEGDLLKLSPDGRVTEGVWLKGFNSNPVLVSPAKVSKEDYAGLKAYAGKIADLESETGMDFFDLKDETRLYLTAKDDSAIFQFQIEERLNPSTGETILGMAMCGWNESVQLLNNRVQEMVDVIPLTARVVAVKPLPPRKVETTVVGIAKPTNGVYTPTAKAKPQVDDDFDVD